MDDGRWPEVALDSSYRTRMLHGVDLGAPELLIILLLVLVLFGGAKLPSLARSLGEAKREFEKATHEGANTDEDPPAQ